MIWQFISPFIIGLTSGGISCMAMQGGLLASVIANQKQTEIKNQSAGWRTKLNQGRIDALDVLPVASFLSAKLVSHFILGFLLGALGSVIELNLTMRLTFQMLAALFMLATALNLLQAHPIFRYLTFTPPKFLQKLVRNTAKGNAIFTPAILGFLTIFIPCGVTQAMEVQAINSGNPLIGAMTLFSFVLGTVPIFAVLGVATSRLSETWNKRFTKLAAASLIIMFIYSVNGVAIVTNFPITLQKIVKPVTWFFSEERFSGTSNSETNVINGVQKVTINIRSNGYNPRYIKVKNNQPVELTLSSVDTYSCALSFVLKEFGISTFLNATDTKTFNFTPTRKGKFTYTCSMGMYTGTLEVI